MTAIDFKAFVERLANAAGEAILPFFRTTLSIEDKGRSGRFDPVTAADRAAEAATRAGQPVYGMMHQPFTREQFTGDGAGANYSGPTGKRSLRVRPCGSLDEAI